MRPAEAVTWSGGGSGDKAAAEKASPAAADGAKERAALAWEREGQHVGPWATGLRQARGQNPRRPGEWVEQGGDVVRWGPMR